MIAAHQNKSVAVTSVKRAGYPLRVGIPITSVDKPCITDEIVNNWQSILDITAKLINVPSALIMKVGKEDIEVFLKSESVGNPYHQQEKAPLESGLYCETVMAQRKPLLVSNALTDDEWKDNPDVELNMISYYGLPLQWPDGSIFGTYCILDNKENSYSNEHFELVGLFKEAIESHLKILVNNDELKAKSNKRELQLKELRHRVKNNFNIIISLIHLSDIENDTHSKADLQTIVNELEDKIMGISLVHEKLSMKKDWKEISLREYIEDLVEHFKSGTDKSILFNIKIPHEVDINADQLITLGLIFNELITNSIKHAFHHVANPEINISVLRTENYLDVMYSDNGPGIPADFFTERPGHLGNTILEGLTEQIGEGIHLLPSLKGYAFNIK